MSYLGRVWMAASVAVVQGGQWDGRHAATKGVISLHQSLRVSTSSAETTAVDVRPISTAMSQSNRDGDEKRQADESLRRVMYLNCWS